MNVASNKLKGGYILFSDGTIVSPRYKGRRLLPEMNSRGYLHYRLTVDGKRTNEMVHRLVAQAFVPNPENKRCVNHIDGSKINNDVSNLEWATHSENTQHAFRIGLQKPPMTKGESIGTSKLTEKKVKEIRESYTFRKNTQPLLAEKYGVSRSTIARILAKDIWRHV